jgi:hypothetical protein
MESGSGCIRYCLNLNRILNLYNFGYSDVNCHHCLGSRAQSSESLDWSSVCLTNVPTGLRANHGYAVDHLIPLRFDKLRLAVKY